MTAQIINLANYRKAKEAEQVRKVVNDYFAAHSQMMAWWLSGGFRRLIAGTAIGRLLWRCALLAAGAGTRQLLKGPRQWLQRRSSKLSALNRRWRNYYFNRTGSVHSLCRTGLSWRP